MIHYTEPSRRIIALEGPDARSFLQGLVTVDVFAVSEDRPRYAAMLTPQGKFLHDFFIRAVGEVLLLDVAADRAADLRSRLLLYRLRAKVEVNFRDDLSVLVFWPEEPAMHVLKGIVCMLDPRHVMPAYRVYGAPAAVRDVVRSSGAHAATEAEYHAFRIAYGVPEAGVDLIPERSLIMEYGFEQLRGVDFSKGCYVGQEVTARSKFRATLRKQLFYVYANAPLASGEVLAAGKAVGEVFSVAGTAGLALLNVEAEQVSRGGGAAISVNGIPLKAERPAWLESAGEKLVPVV